MSAEQKIKRDSLIKKILLIIPTLFLIELVLGGNGAFITIHGIYLRIILFVLAFGCLGLYVLLYARKFRFKVIDWFVLGFIAVNVVWMTVIPYIKYGSISMALSDANDIFGLFIYFPVVILIRKGELNWMKTKNLFLVLTVILAAWHIVMYVLESLSPGIYEDYYMSFLPAISLGSYTPSAVIYGYGYVRIILSTSIYMIIGLMYAVSLKQKKIIHYIFIFLLTVGIMTTLTRSVLISTIVGLLMFMIPIHRTMLGKALVKRIALVVGIFAVALIVNFTLIAPLSNTYVNNVMEKYNSIINKYDESSHSDDSSQLDGLSETELGVIYGVAENEGNVVDRIASSTSQEDIGNDLRQQQTDALIKEWKKSPVMGFGYGHYVADFTRNDQHPFMYETIVPALLMKLGILGLLPWAALILCMVFLAVRYAVKNKRCFELMGWLAPCVAFFLAIQTNPFLFTFCGFSIVIYLLLELDNIRRPDEGKEPAANMAEPIK